MEIIGIGLANIDLVSHIDERFLHRHKIRKSDACELDALSFARLKADLESYDALPGGCAANTLCGLGATGIPARFLGKIGADSFESVFRAAFADYGVAYDVVPDVKESSQCAVLVTPDGERSFAYTHGASWELTEADIPVSALEAASMIYVEVYIFDFGPGQELARKVSDTAERRGIPLVMKIMDRVFAAKYAQKIRALADAGILSLIVGNHKNLPALVGTDDHSDALEQFKDWNCPVLMTANIDGAYYIGDGGDVSHFPVKIVENPKNTVGAGDQFAAGFLAGWLDKKPVADCMAFAAAQARQILMHDTARPPLRHQKPIRF